MLEFKKFLVESQKPKKLLGMKIVYVDSKKFRKTSLSHEEFCIVAIHEDFPDAISKDEIWVDKNIKNDELTHILDGVTTRINDLRKGKSSSSSYENGLKTDYKKRKHNLKIKKEHYISLQDPKGKINVFFVSGNAIRSNNKIDFSQGGHGFVYKWIPKGEIWIEAEEREEVAPILAHEYVEMAMMRDLGMAYDEAHKVASKVEKYLRERGFGPKDYKKMTGNIGLLVDLS